MQFSLSIKISGGFSVLYVFLVFIFRYFRLSLEVSGISGEHDLIVQSL